MIRYLRYLVLVAIVVMLVTVALANRDVVTLRLLPTDLADLAGSNWAIDLPLFVVIFGGVVAGVLIGFVWEWLREHKHRAAVSAKSRELDTLKREVERAAPPPPKDEVLALLEAPRKAG